MDATGTVGHHYRRSRERLTALLGDTATADLDRPVAACPGWSVRDVLAHLVGTVEDALAGRLTGIPTDEQTAAQVAARRGVAPETLLATWAAAAPAFEDVVSGLSVWPAAIDAVSHEHDIRHALGRPGFRDDPSVVHLAGLMAGAIEAPAAVTVDYGAGSVTGGDPEGEPITLTTTAF
ncbi:MAG TPA: maleylpyruvate isomerase family mycothiol-dependent enzyme, partial [Acidimicrobiales bacterium]|nr:maleylpyruvate isomerase family mycothiol-dependent enzyme [Acidimicrobiales bacterium]